MAIKGMLIDVNYCSGCGNCAEACRKRQGFEGDPDEVAGLSATARTALEPLGDFNVRQLCRHCLDPCCVAACPANALVRTEHGAVRYDASRCMGCRYCMISCPFDIPRYEWDRVAPRIQKCDLCWDRVAAGEMPACAEACTAEATIFGDREELLAIARERIEEDPDEYLDHIFGEKDLGGSAVLMIGPKALDVLRRGLPLDGASPAEIARTVIREIPGFATVGAAAFLGIWWFAGRRDRVREAEAGGDAARRPLPSPRHRKDGIHV